MKEMPAKVVVKSPVKGPKSSCSSCPLCHSSEAIDLNFSAKPSEKKYQILPFYFRNLMTIII